MKLTLTPHGELCKLENEIGAEEIVRRASGWIKLSERKPTEADADENGKVLSRWKQQGTTSLIYSDHRWEYLQSGWETTNLHWHPLSKFQEQDKDDKAFNEWFLATANQAVSWKEAWDAALEYARNKQ